MEEDKYLEVAEDEDVAEEAVKEGSEKSCITPQLLSILSFLILVSGACFSIDWSSAVYLLAGCLYFSRFIGARSLMVMIWYAILILVAEIVVLILSFSTNLLDDFDSLTKELLIAFGFGSITKDVGKSILTILPELFVAIGLLFVKCWSCNNQENELRKSKNLFLCHLWFWLMIGFLVVVYTFGETGCYLAVSCTLCK